MDAAIEGKTVTQKEEYPGKGGYTKHRCHTRAEANGEKWYFGVSEDEMKGVNFSSSKSFFFSINILSYFFFFIFYQR